MAKVSSAVSVTQLESAETTIRLYHICLVKVQFLMQQQGEYKNQATVHCFCSLHVPRVQGQGPASQGGLKDHSMICRHVLLCLTIATTCALHMKITPVHRMTLQVVSCKMCTTRESTSHCHVFWTHHCACMHAYTSFVYL